MNDIQNKINEIYKEMAVFTGMSEKAAIFRVANNHV